MEDTNGAAFATPQERLRQRLNDPETAETLLHILDKADIIALTVDSMDGLLRRGDEIIESVSDGVREMRDAVPANEVNIQKTTQAVAEALPSLTEALPQITESLPHLLALTQQLRDPTTSQALDQILNKMELVAFTLNSLDSFLQRSDVVIDSVVKGVQEIREMAPSDEMNLLVTLAETLPELTAMLPQLIESLPKLLALLPLLSGVIAQLQTILESEEFAALMESGVFAPQTVGIVGQAGGALVESYEANQATPQSVGMFGLVGALRDPDIQRALGFFIDFGRRFGQAMDK